MRSSKSSILKVHFSKFMKTLRTKINVEIIMLLLNLSYNYFIQTVNLKIKSVTVVSVLIGAVFVVR